MTDFFLFYQWLCNKLYDIKLPYPENFHILENVHILDFYMNLYKILYKAFHILENIFP